MGALTMGLGAALALGGAYLAFVQRKKAEGEIAELKFTPHTSLKEVRRA